MPKIYRKRRNVKRRRYARRNPRVARSIMFNASPVFTETVYAGTIAPNTGGVLKVNINNVPQTAFYSGLYQKYRILKASWTLIPQYSGSDINQASYNAGNNVFAWGMGRFASAIDDSPAGVPPVSEAALLQHNGVKIRPVKTSLKLSNRPVPNTLDANGNLMTLGNKYLNFTQSGVDHFGISYWYSQPSVGSTSLTNNELHIYVKVTFQLSDPR